MVWLQRYREVRSETDDLAAFSSQAAHGDTNLLHKSGEVSEIDSVLHLGMERPQSKYPLEGLGEFC